MVDVNEYTRETTCEYKGELYSVRDNGAVMRHTPDGKKARKLDNVWTFGKKNNKNGYMMVNTHRVHIIVAKAFIPGNEDGKMIVDHIDTNRCNNRVENLRWLTRLENVLLNEVTLKRVTYLCGGDINKFINDPSCLRDLTGNNPDLMWMRTVTAEEAKKAWEHISAWAKRPNSTFKIMQFKDKVNSFEDWLKIHDTKGSNLYESIKSTMSIEKATNTNVNNTSDWDSLRNEFYSNRDIELPKETFDKQIEESTTINAWQAGFFEKMTFPLCPDDTSGGLDAYAYNLKKGNVIARSNEHEYTIDSVGWTEDWNSILVEVKLNGNRIYSYIHIRYEGGTYIHNLDNYVFNYPFCDSPNVLQCGAKTQFYFPLCPKEGNITLEEYANRLKKGALFEINKYTKGYVVDSEITHTTDGEPYLYVGINMPDSIKHYGDVYIFIENGRVIHQLGKSYFELNYLKREFCRIRGQKWDDSIEVFDDYC
ncbi:MAG: HNH endonuclease signature motif containing protein [Bacteroidales bacterium]|nr:HNH endonuclease signature motif containing protein [Bacteroidales bacterium]